MPIDPNIALNANAPQPVNPLQQALQVAQYRYMNANSQQMQQGVNANRAVSQAYQQATDPTTGKVDNNKLLGIISQNPDAAYNMPSIVSGINTQNQQQITNDTSTFDLKKKQMDWGNATSGMIASNPNATQADVLDIMRQGVQNKMIDPQSAMMVLATLPPANSPPGAVSAWAAHHIANAAGPQAQLTAMTPTPTLVNSGGSQQYVDTNALTNPNVIGQKIQNTLTPSDATSQVPIVQPNGATGTISKASVAQAQGQGNLVGGAPGAQPSPIGNGRYPSGGAAPSAPAAPGGVLQTGLAPGVAQAADVAGTASGNQMVGDQQANAGSGQRVYQLQAALTGLQNAGPTGPGTAEVNNAKSFLLAQSPDWMKAHLPGVDPNQIASYDEANKYLTQYASAKASSLGSGTDSKLATTLSGNASTHISGLAAQDVVKANIGLERMGQAQQDAFSQSGLPAAEYSKWASKFGSTLDPRVFIADQMDPAKVKGMYDKMQPKEQAQFRTQYNWAVQKGYLNGPQ